MNASINISPDPKLLTNSALPVLIEPLEEMTPGHHRVLKPMPSCTIENIHHRAEMVTPTLQGILEIWPTEHWENLR